MLVNGEPESPTGPQRLLLRCQPSRAGCRGSLGHLLCCPVSLYCIQDLWPRPLSFHSSCIGSQGVLCVCQAPFYLRTFALTLPSTWVPLPQESLLARLTPSLLLVFAQKSLHLDEPSLTTPLYIAALPHSPSPSHVVDVCFASPHSAGRC